MHRCHLCHALPALELTAYELDVKRRLAPELEDNCTLGTGFVAVGGI
jgi:hypothetical protein